MATEDLDAYKTSKVLSAYEITGKQLMLYLSALPASGSQTFKSACKPPCPSPPATAEPRCTCTISPSNAFRHEIRHR